MMDEMRSRSVTDSSSVPDRVGAMTRITCPAHASFAVLPALELELQHSSYNSYFCRIFFSLRPQFGSTRHHRVPVWHESLLLLPRRLTRIIAANAARAAPARGGPGWRRQMLKIEIRSKFTEHPLAKRVSCLVCSCVSLRI